MALAQYVEHRRFDPETRRIMGLAFEVAVVAFRRARRSEVTHEMIAEKVSELAQAGERDPDRLAEAVLASFPRIQFATHSSF
jgi:hypothetical protein